MLRRSGVDRLGKREVPFRVNVTNGFAGRSPAVIVFSETRLNARDSADGSRRATVTDVGVALTAVADASIVYDATRVRRVPARLPPADLTDGGGASRAPVPVPPSAVSGPVVDVSWFVPQVEPEEVLVRLQTERAALNSGYGHPHAAMSCAFCRRAAAAYR